MCSVQARRRINYELRIGNYEVNCFGYELEGKTLPKDLKPSEGRMSEL